MTPAMLLNSEEVLTWQISRDLVVHLELLAEMIKPIGAKRSEISQLISLGRRTDPVGLELDVEARCHW